MSPNLVCTGGPQDYTVTVTISPIIATAGYRNGPATAIVTAVDQISPGNSLTTVKNVVIHGGIGTGESGESNGCDRE